MGKHLFPLLQQAIQHWTLQNNWCLQMAEAGADLIELGNSFFGPELQKGPVIQEADDTSSCIWCDN